MVLQLKIQRRIAKLMRRSYVVDDSCIDGQRANKEINRPMALVTCSKKQRAKTCPTKSQTKSNTTLKDRMHKLDVKWNKLRPYIERLNGTIVPLQSQEARDDEVARRLEHEQRTVEEEQQLSARATL